ncbi:class I adenylate-forming enzyme family protein [Brevibacterium luteolum]|uniref:class I adenylate-forming enzyme family protein n=1 Tax=Brevibacterium luteolum TaxID=199591 RepID=UPI00223A923A|nr:AMP-binding protein [Brevibacterium luteolum]MCT1829375.1 AMP-binding protein [Brevibacterium luteolum]
MSISETRPWLKTYSHLSQLNEPVPHTTGDALLRETVEKFPNRRAITYFGYEPTWAEVDRQTDAYAAWLTDKGIGKGDRIGVYLQNTPHYHIAVFGAWKVGAIPVPLNPMYRDELSHIFADSGIRGLVVSAAAYLDRVKNYSQDLEWVLTCQDTDFQTTNDERIFGIFADHYDTGCEELLDVVKANEGRSVPASELSPDDTAIIGYTSGTSGRSKGAAVTHRGVSVNSLSLGIHQGLDENDVIFTLAPVFHITGFVCQFIASVAIGAALAMNYRFEPASTLEIFRREKPQYMVGPATAYMALLAHPTFDTDAFDSFKSLMSGGAPLPDAIVRKFEERTGHYIGQGYGLTETTAQCVVVPPGMRAPVDPDSGNLSCGLPVPDTVVRVLDDEGNELGPREVGEICVRGPMVVSQYINNPGASASEIPDGELKTGDVGFMDEDGWVFIVDRKKDMINAAGFKVWPREVEDVLYTHPAVLEAAVVGVPDEYRGESVTAFVSLQPGAEATEDELVAYCREHLASYKAPRHVNFIEALPKTASGKILRREMRRIGAEQASSEAS